ncbi:MAG: thioester reductase domain-containing protein, partial [Pseudomonadota bacterium]
KNEPIKKFLEELTDRYQGQQTHDNFIFSSLALERCSLASDDNKPTEKQAGKVATTDSQQLQKFSQSNYIINFILENLADINNISKFIEKTHDTNIHVATPKPVASGPVDKLTDLEEQIQALWLKITKKKVTDVNANFFDLGGSSLQLIQLLLAIRKHFKLEFPHDMLIRQPTIAEISKVISYHQQHGSFEAKTQPLNLVEAASLDAAIKLSLQTKVLTDTPDNILLTGSTGYLGAYLLYELVDNTNATIYCIIRSKTIAQAKRKLIENLEKFHLNKPEILPRIQIILGDLAQPDLGLSQDNYNLLAATVEVIYHNAAMVNFTMPYETLEKINVQGTQEIVKFACEKRIKHLHYISSTAIFDSTEYSKNDEIFETSLEENPHHVVGGYAQTKWVAEKMVWEAAKYGLPVTVYRPGGIAPANNQVAKFNMSDMLTSFMLLSIQMKKIFLIDDVYIDFSNVDYIASAIVYLSQQKTNPNRVFHLSHPQPIRFNELIKLLDQLGENMELLAFDAWQEAVSTYAKANNDVMLETLMPLISEKLSTINKTWLEIALDRPKFNCDATNEALTNSSIICAKFDSKLTLKYLLLTYIALERQQLLIEEENPVISVPLTSQQSNYECVLIRDPVTSKINDEKLLKFAEDVLEDKQLKVTTESKIIELTDISQVYSRLEQLGQFIQQDSPGTIKQDFDEIIDLFVNGKYAEYLQYHKVLAEKIVKIYRSKVYILTTPSVLQRCLKLYAPKSFIVTYS